MDIKTIGLELLRDVKSRKYTLCLGYPGLVYFNSIDKLDFSSKDMDRILILFLAFIIAEGIRDIVEALK